MTFKEQKNLWKVVYPDEYQLHMTVAPIDINETDKKVVYMDDLEKRKRAYGICGECDEPGTGEEWCQPCNSKRFKENFKNWTSGNKDIDELIQQSQINAIHYKRCIEWIPFENFYDVTYITRGGLGKIFSAKWPEGYIESWNIENEKWERWSNVMVALKSLDDSSGMSTEFVNEIKSHLQIHLWDIIQCYGITQDPVTKDYMMVLKYCKDGNLRNFLNNSGKNMDYGDKIGFLSEIIRGLIDIHHAEKVHKDFHSGNILFNKAPYISDLGMCQPVNNGKQSIKQERVYGVLPYMAPEVLCGQQYTKAADIYSFGIVMNEFISEETPYENVPNDHILAIAICKGLRPEISKDTPKLLADLIIKCWDANAENRPTAKEVHHILKKLNREKFKPKSTIYSQIKGCEKIRKIKLSKEKPKINITHPQAVYTSRFLNFKNLPNPINSSNLSLFQDGSGIIQLISKNIKEISISECYDCEIDKSKYVDCEIDKNEFNCIIVLTKPEN
ncbi:kinase-like domain-containing protein [Glomus cerebriforme]|uniref:Kinase-like domain-containing protein n=1 Tax=Glomus cerebriforme TaxID=658196 RepID=A0A397T7S0_9GLOM|nr:kinase-like domain-containing protein [Glomus cerebriforme]